jgi:5'-nucleotidase (lipoprotein e(P4) family)
MENMKRLGFPQVSEEHFKLRTTTSSKEERRMEIAKNYKIVALLGDNLVDMNAAFDKAPENERQHVADSLRLVWGDHYIVFPNATYGDWENALYMDYRKAHPTEKIISLDSIYAIRVRALKQY